ncbi:glycoside hydrolase family 92 protein [Seonamhaeicola sediminis]|uniref:Glycosyl hydrolase family 92 n=2 Tax=Seonamhaeicola TaxID=1649495 RepID=A0A3D9HDE2_9FLAO|nr:MULTISPECIES: glycoside hydrolase domain-containing protein [Seonamhaeicola]RED47488.1 glycosyl hydrolase family 92 [Seonamhaeicola aphaedonensis]TWO34660.1 glycoside hydrolase family 92 protein [Seonamhaeicola sediminis]
MERAMRYKNVLDPETKLVRGRNADGTWRDPKDFAISGWTGHDEKQRNIYYHNIMLFAPHDVQGLVNFMGGDDAFIEFLDNFFPMGDEWSMHAPLFVQLPGTTVENSKDYQRTAG